MSVINVRDRLITLKVVYYGPAAGGKTTSLQAIHRVLDPEATVQLVTLATAGDKTLFFDFLPIDLGTLGGFRLRVQGFTVPGQVKYALTRRYVVAGADAVIFVANSDPACPRENAESLSDLDENLRANGLNANTVPLVIQYNKRDLPDARELDDLSAEVRFRPVPEYETTATTGQGVFAAFRDAIGRAVMNVAADARVDPRGAQSQVYAKLDAYYDRNEPLPSAGADAATVVVPMSDGAEPETGDPKELLGHALDSGVQLSRMFAEVNVARRRLETAVKSANALNQLARRLLAAETPGQVWKEFYRVCRDHVPASCSSLLIRRNAGDPLEAAELDGIDAEPLLAAIGEDGTKVLTELTEPTALNERDEPEIIAAVRQTAADVRALLVAPISARGRFRGAVVFYRGGGHPPFHLKDTRMLSSAASFTSMGLARALHERELAAAAAGNGSGVSALDVAEGIGRPLATLTSSVDALGSLVTEIERAFRRMDAAVERPGESDVLSAIRLSLADPDLLQARTGLRSIAEDAADQASRISLKLRMLLRPRSDSEKTHREADPATGRP